MLRKIRIWFRAHSGWRYWRVTYRDGKRTYPLQYDEAKGLSEVFDAKIWIDYTIKYDI